MRSFFQRKHDNPPQAKSASKDPYRLWKPRPEHEVPRKPPDKAARQNTSSDVIKSSDKHKSSSRVPQPSNEAYGPAVSASAPIPSTIKLSSSKNRSNFPEPSSSIPNSSQRPEINATSTTGTSYNVHSTTSTHPILDQNPSSAALLPTSSVPVFNDDQHLQQDVHASYRTREYAEEQDRPRLKERSGREREYEERYDKERWREKDSRDRTNNGDVRERPRVRERDTEMDESQIRARERAERERYAMERERERERRERERAKERERARDRERYERERARERVERDRERAERDREREKGREEERNRTWDRLRGDESRMRAERERAKFRDRDRDREHRPRDKARDLTERDRYRDRTPRTKEYGGYEYYRPPQKTPARDSSDEGESSDPNRQIYAPSKRRVNTYGQTAPDPSIPVTYPTTQTAIPLQTYTLTHTLNPLSTSHHTAQSSQNSGTKSLLSTQVTAPSTQHSAHQNTLSASSVPKSMLINGSVIQNLHDHRLKPSVVAMQASQSNTPSQNYNMQSSSKITSTVSPIPATGAEPPSAYTGQNGTKASSMNTQTLQTSAQYSSFVPDGPKLTSTTQDSSKNPHTAPILKSAHLHLLNESQSGNEGFGTSSGSENERRVSHEHRSRRKRDRKAQEPEDRLASIAEQQTAGKYDNSHRHGRQTNSDDRASRGPFNPIPVSTSAREKSRTTPVTFPENNPSVAVPAPPINGSTQTTNSTPPQPRHDGWGLPDQATIPSTSQRKDYIPPIRPIPDSPALVPIAQQSIPGRGEIGDPITWRPPSRSHLQPPKQTNVANHSPQQNMYAKWTPPTPSKVSPTLKSSDHSRSTSHGHVSNSSPPKRGLIANESPASGHSRRTGEHSPSNHIQHNPSGSLVPGPDHATVGYHAMPHTHPSVSNAYDYQIVREKSAGKVSELVAGIEARSSPADTSNTKNVTPPQSSRPLQSSQPSRSRDRTVSLSGEGAPFRAPGDSSPSFNVSLTANNRGRVVSFSASNNASPNTLEVTSPPPSQSVAKSPAHAPFGGKAPHLTDDKLARLAFAPNPASQPVVSAQVNQQVSDVATKLDLLKRADGKGNTYSPTGPLESRDGSRATGSVDRTGFQNSAGTQHTSGSVSKMHSRTEGGPPLLFQPNPTPPNTSATGYKGPDVPPRPSSTMPFSHPKLAELLSDNLASRQSSAAPVSRPVYSEVPPAQGATTVRTQTTFPEPSFISVQRSTPHHKQSSANPTASRIPDTHGIPVGPSFGGNDVPHHSRNASAPAEMTAVRPSPHFLPKQPSTSDLAPNTPLKRSQPFETPTIQSIQGPSHDLDNSVNPHQSRNFPAQTSAQTYARTSPNSIPKQPPSSDLPSASYLPSSNKPPDGRNPIPPSINPTSAGKNYSQQGYSSASAQAMRTPHSTLQKSVTNEPSTTSSRPADYPHRVTHVQSQNGHSGLSAQLQFPIQSGPGLHAPPYPYTNSSNLPMNSNSESVNTSQRYTRSLDPDSSSAYVNHIHNSTSQNVPDLQPNAASKNKLSLDPKDAQFPYDSTSGLDTHLPTSAVGQTNQSALVSAEQGTTVTNGRYPPLDRTLPRSSSQEALLKTPSSLATSLKPTASRTSNPASIQTQSDSRKKGFLSRFIPKNSQTEDPHQVWHPVPESTLDVPGKQSGVVEVETQRKTLSSRARVPPPINIPIPISTSGRKSPNAKPFTPFRYLSTSKRNRTMSAASLEAANGSAPNTVGSPTASMHSSQPPFHPPARRDPHLATQEWRDRDHGSFRGGDKVKMRRPGVVFDVAHEPSEDKQNLKYSKSKSRSRSKR